MAKRRDREANTVENTAVVEEVILGRWGVGGGVAKGEGREAG